MSARVRSGSLTVGLPHGLSLVLEPVANEMLEMSTHDNMFTIRTISEHFEETYQALWPIQVVLRWTGRLFDCKFHSGPSAGRHQHACVSF